MTIRTPVPPRYKKLLESLRKTVEVNLVTGLFIPATDSLGMNTGTILAYATLLFKSARAVRPGIVDIHASIYLLFKRTSDLVVDFRTPFPLELEWFGHRSLASVARRLEKSIQNRLVFAANERMAALCKELGAGYVFVLPNYPTRDFEATMKSDAWKTACGLNPERHVVLFTSSKTGWRLRAIYGLDLLLESWQLVEPSADADLVILGEPNAYLRMRMRSLGLRHVILPGTADSCGVANWVNCADVCLAPRTPGFPRNLYDDKDSTKISEYAAFRKPIVAAGYAPSDQYLLVDQTPEALAEGILKGLSRKITLPEPHYWDENESSVLDLLEEFWFK